MAGSIPDAPSFAQIEPFVYVFQGAGPMHIASLLLEDVDRLFLIDTQLEDENNHALIAQIKRQFPDKPLDTVIISHYHLDHYLGLKFFQAAFGDFAIVGPPDARRQMDHSTEAIWETYEEVSQQRTLTKADVIYPAREVSQGFTISFSGREMQFELIGPNEAWATLVGYLPDTKTLYASDVLLRGIYIDPAIGGTVQGWANESAALLDTYPDIGAVISGHVVGLSTREELAAFAASIAQTIAIVRELIAGGAAVEDVLSHEFPPAITLFARDFTLRNIYNELRATT